MRTTLNTVYSQIGTNLNKITTDINQINERISSGRQMSKISDDPVNLVSALRFRSSIGEVDQYIQNISDGDTIISSSESALTQMKELIINAKTLAIKAIDPALGHSEHLSIAAEIKNTIEQSVILGNTQINGKYIFGGHRTSGYTAEEPAPFVIDKGNGYWVNGSSMAPLANSLNSTIPGTAAVVTDILDGELLVNGDNVGPIPLNTNLAGDMVDGVNMGGASQIVTAFNSVSTSYTGSAATADPADGTDSEFQFDLNGETIDLTITDNSTANAVATQTRDAINLASAKTGVTASLNGDAVVFQNTIAGDNSTIEVNNFQTVQYGGADIGFKDFSKQIVTSSLTTLYASAAVVTDETTDGFDSIFAVDLNDTTINVRIPDGTLAADTTSLTVAAINLMSDLTGVTAEVGTGNNGGALDSIVFKNSQVGDDSAITLSNYTTFQGDADPANLAALGAQAADATHNTGEISMEAEEPITITSPNHTDDTILDSLGIGGGGVGFMDDKDDGSLLFGYDLATDDLLINGIKVPTVVDDGLSDKYGVTSAAAKANAINSITSQTGVQANIIPASMSGTGSVSGGTELTRLTGMVTGNVVLAGDFAINDTALPIPIPASGGASNGLFMDSAENARSAINNEFGTTGVRAKTTTLYSSNVTATVDTADFIRSEISFDLNGETINLSIPDGSTAAEVADITAYAINLSAGTTGVEAVVGSGANGGAAGSIVFKNAVKGDESIISVSNYAVTQGDATLGFGNFNQVADATHNTGEISLESESEFTLTSPTTTPANPIFAELGLQADIGTEEIKYGATPAYLHKGDLVINGVDMFPTDTAIQDSDQNNAIVRTINAKTAQTGVTASRSDVGNLVLSAVDGRNINISTSLNGENVTHLNSNNGEKVYFGSLQLSSLRDFNLETTYGPHPNSYEPAFQSLGLSGGASSTGESGDVSGDGKIHVKTVRDQVGSVRYAGDRESDLSIKIGKIDTMLVGENGQTAIADTDIFTILRDFEDALEGTKFNTVTGIHSATDTGVLLNSRNTGLETESLLPSEDLFQEGSFSVNVYDNAYHPPKESTMIIGVDPANDSLDDVMERINGIPGMQASWTSSGQLNLESDDPSRYSFTLDEANNNFLEVTGVSAYFIQEQAFEKTLADLDAVMGSLTEQISDFGAKSHRIDTQSMIFTELQITSRENLSEVQDTDLIKAVMDLKAKEVAYQAALSSAAKTMQLSLIDYL